MKVTQMALYRNLFRNIEKSSNTANKLYLQAATGSKLQQASDNPAVVGITLASRTAISETERYLNTIAGTQENLDILDGFLDGAEDILVRAKEIAIYAGNGTLSAADRETLAAEVENLKASLLDIANAQVDGKYLFSGYADTSMPFSGDPISYQGTNDHKMVEISSGRTVQTSLTGSEVFSEPEDLFAMLDDLVSALNDNDSETLNRSIDDLENGANQIRGKRSAMGNINSRLDDVATLAENLKLQMEARLSRCEDADLVEVMSGITQAELGYEAALAVSGRISRLSILNYL